MRESGDRAGFPLESCKGLGVLREPLGKDFQGHVVPSFVSRAR